MYCIARQGVLPARSREQAEVLLSEAALHSLAELFEAVPDPRGAHGLGYDLPFLLTCLDEPLALDGKTVREARSGAQTAPHRLSFCTHHSQETLWQVRVEEKTNEIPSRKRCCLRCPSDTESVLPMRGPPRPPSCASSMSSKPRPWRALTLLVCRKGNQQ